MINELTEQAEDQLEKSVFDTDRWLLSNNLISIHLKNDLFVYGAISHEEHVKALKVSIDLSKKQVNYVLFVPQRVLKASEYIKYNKNSSNLLKLIKVLFIHKRYGNLNFDIILNKFVKDRCGNDWSAHSELEDIKKYKEDIIDG